ncbi:MAG: Anaerobic sulfatase-maturating enzyme [Promethearchaeota archaeon]|nr:MAG: Anaerobic sulfatase-maturating enzyme [Candidatus Lokiarchaeota archaeon]
MQPFQLLIKPVSFDCNLRCKYCFYLEVESQYPNKAHPKMNFETLEKMISDYLKMRFPESIFGWQGGEPTVAGLDFFRKVVFLQQKHGRNGQVIGNALQTNGILINQEWVEFLNKYKFLVGLSLDGPKDIHDRYRRSIGGKSVWKKVMNAAELFQKNSVEFNILCVISKANINRARKVYQFFLEHNFKHLQFIPALEANLSGKKASFSVNTNQYGKFLCDLFDIWVKDPNQASIRIFNSILAHYLGRPQGFCTLEKTCANYLLIEHNGDVYPCDFFVKKEYKLGNLMKETFSELKHKRDNKFLQYKLNLSDDCLNCGWLELCYGGCIKDRIFPDNPHPDRTYYCEGYKRFFSHTHEWFKNQAERIKAYHR